MATDKTHYDVLGVARDASLDEIRRSYRALARRLHPDLAGDDGAAVRRDVPHVSMAEVNRAWDVLSDAASRREYDAYLGRPYGINSGQHAASGSRDFVGTHSTTTSGRENIFDQPRFPWRAMLVLAAVGSIAVLTAHAGRDPDVPFAPDQLLQPGSCVVIDQNGDAVEVMCTEPHDGVVRQFVPIDQTCPMDTESHRDRQGMGTACVDLTRGNGG